MDPEHGIEEAENGLHDPGVVHEDGYPASEEKEFGNEEECPVVVFESEGQGGINDDIPPGDERGKVVKGVVGVHCVGQDHREDVESD